MAETDKNVAPASVQPQPGQVVAPGGGPASTPVAAHPPTPVPQPAPPTPVAPVIAPSNPTPVISAQDIQSTMPPAPAAESSEDAISWTASEFVAHEKTTGWYLALAGIAIAIAALIFFIARDIISIVVVLVAAIAFGVLGSRKPRQRHYSLSAGGLSIGERHYGYNEFRSFSVVPEGAFSSIVFMPLKRFAPLTTIYYAPEDEDKIVDIISINLPFEERKSDPIDSLMTRIRF